MVLACDETGRFTGEYVRRDVAHTGDGQRHLAIAVLLHDPEHRLLLQRRRHPLFDSTWDLTGATHQLHLPGGDETAERAARRCLDREYGIQGVFLRECGGFEYFARDGGRCENEYCALLVGEYEGPVTLNEEVGYGYRWAASSELLAEIAEAPETYTPWALAGIDVLRRSGFFERPA